MKFCRELVAGDETASYLGQYVKECTVTHWMQAVEEGQWVFANFLKVYVKSITRLVNLETLRLHDTPIDLKFLAGLGALEKLRSLSISHCEFKSLTKDYKSSTPPLRLTHFELRSHRDALLAPLSQIIASSFLRTLHTNSWGFLRAVMSQTVDFSIETLAIPIYIPEIVHLRDFLNKTPSITELSISDVLFTGPYNQLLYPMLDLAPSSLPRLSRLECPACLISDLVPGRPLQSIRINSRVLDGSRSREDVMRDEKRALSVLKRSTAPITTLRVSGDVYTSASFDQIFPQLNTLILDIPLAPVHSKVRLSKTYAQNGHAHRLSKAWISVAGHSRRGISIFPFNSQLCPELLQHFRPSYSCVSPTKWNGEDVMSTMVYGILLS
ncbi:hypothetical protein PILCRDRAFT_538401 [Piloderma croceum F 1598]|uniref:F-box domain-containing protein n=1 Tax=Piloderma croceum (strain F 1598) TaxID=765440 RepID=A0A0C3FL04_PILCF|nr:hypothetical protein PILCRDRAFT_538401 [Piloderma croceum F 1598]